LPVRPSDLLVKAPGFGTARVALPLETGKDVENFEVTLERAGTLRGRVTSENGAPLDRALVRIAGDAQREQNSEPAVTDPNGEYELTTLPIGEATVGFSKAGFQSIRKIVKSDGSETRLDVQLPAGHVLTGRVVADDGAGIADVEVMAGSEGVDSGYAAAMSDASGRFRIEGLGTGIFTIRATRRGYVDTELPGVDIAKTAEVTVKMSAGATISGHISGIDPSRFKDVTVRVFSTGRGGRITQAAADTAGNYRLEGAPLGKVSVRAYTRGDTMQTSESVDLETQSGGNFQADLEFKEHNTVRGRVSRRGVPLRSGSISFSTIAPPIGSATGSIDADGSYEARGVRSGEQRITVMDYNDMTQYVTSKTVTRSQALDIDMNPAAVTGRVISDATEQPIVDASIALEPVDTDAPRWLKPQGHSGNDGRMLIENIPPGRYQVRITKEGFANYLGEQTLSEGTTATIEARLSPSAGVTLRILDGRNGQPVRAWVGARSSEGKMLYSEFPSARPDGTVSVPLAPGSYRLNIIASGLGPAYVNVTSPGAQDVTLRPGGSLEVTVSDPSIRIRVRTPDGADYNFIPGDDGRPMPVMNGFRLPDLAAGSYLMQVFDANGAAGRSVPFEIRAGETTKLSL
jgi:large repetitive protein